MPILKRLAGGQEGIRSNVNPGLIKRFRRKNFEQGITEPGNARAQYVVLTASEKEDFAGEVQPSLAEGNLAPMDGLQNVWYEGFSLGDDLLEVIVVAMSPTPVDAGPAVAVP